MGGAISGLYKVRIDIISEDGINDRNDLSGGEIMGGNYQNCR